MAFQVIEEMADQKAKEMEPVETQIVEIMPPDIENLIYVVRNKQVMVDSDLAMLYQVETKALNRAVKRNIKRFPEDFCFQLTTEETESLKCQSGTSKIQEPEKKGWTRWQTYATVCIYRAGNIHAGQCIA